MVHLCVEFMPKCLCICKSDQSVYAKSIILSGSVVWNNITTCRFVEIVAFKLK